MRAPGQFAAASTGRWPGRTGYETSNPPGTRFSLGSGTTIPWARRQRVKARIPLRKCAASAGVTATSAGGRWNEHARVAAVMCLELPAMRTPPCGITVTPSTPCLRMHAAKARYASRGEAALEAVPVTTILSPFASVPPLQAEAASTSNSVGGTRRAAAQRLPPMPDTTPGALGLFIVLKKRGRPRVDVFRWDAYGTGATMTLEAEAFSPCPERFVVSRDESVAARPRTRPAADRSLELVEELYRREAPRLRRVAFAIVHDRETAEDVVQEAFASAVLRLRSFRGAGAASGWIWRIVVNAALSKRRRLRLETRARQRSETPPTAMPEVDVAESSLRDQIARLPERQRVALFLRYYADMDYDTIAEVLSIAPGTVGKLLHDARESIARAVEGEVDG